MYVFGKTKNFSFFLTENLKNSNLLFLLNFVTMNQCKLGHSQKMLTNDLIIVTIDSSKITFITYK